MLTRFGAVLLLAVAFATAAASRAEASFIAYVCNDPLCQGSGDFTVADGSGSDLDTSSGVVLSNVSSGGLSILVTTAVSKPATGSTLDPQMHLSFVASGVGSAWLYVVDTDYLFGGTLSGLYGGVNGANSSVQYGIFSSASNSSTLPLDLSKGTKSPVLASTNYSGSMLLGLTNPPPYSLTLMAAINRGAGATGTSSGDLDVTAAVPEPTSIALLGLGLVAVAAGARRRLRRNRSAP